MFGIFTFDVGSPWLNILVICLTNVIGWKHNQFGMENLTNILVDMCLTNILVRYIS